MDSCPICGKKIDNHDQTCPKCGYNLVQSRLNNQSSEKQKDAAVSRAAYRKEFKPTRPNSTVQRMIEWVRKNATIVFLLGVFLLIVTSFSAILGWITFFALMSWLFIVCNRSDRIDRYVVDQKLTQKMNQIGANAVNSISDESVKVKEKREKFQSKHPKLSKKVSKIKSTRRYSYVQISIILLALVNLILMFYSSSSAVVDNMYTQKVSLSKVLLTVGRMMLASSQTVPSAILVYGIWLLLLLIPIFTVSNILKNTPKGQRKAFLLSLIETIIVGYIIYHLSNNLRANSGIFSQLTSQLIVYAASVGTSIYFLIFTNTITTVLALYNLLTRKEDKENKQ